MKVRSPEYVSVCLCFAIGCSVNTDSIQAIAQRSLSTVATQEPTSLANTLQSELGRNSESLTSDALSEGENGGTPETSVQRFVSTAADLPSPGRVNPFELSGEFRSETSETGSIERKREISILGFIEVDEPSVMLSIDGKTSIMKTGDKVSGVSVLEIAPPQARLNLDGVSWNASLFDRRK